MLVAIPFGFYLHTMRLPASYVLVLWFVLQIGSSMMRQGEGGGVVSFAHIGGFIAGMALIPLFKDRDVPLFQPARRGNWDD